MAGFRPGVESDSPTFDSLVTIEQSQAPNLDPFITLRSTAIDGGLDFGGLDTDIFYAVRGLGASGGVLVQAIAPSTYAPAYRLYAYAGSVAGGIGFGQEQSSRVEISALNHDPGGSSAGAITDIDAGTNLFSVSAHEFVFDGGPDYDPFNKFMVNSDGDSWFAKGWLAGGYNDFLTIAGISPYIQLVGDDAPSSAIALFRTADDATGPGIYLTKSRDGTPGDFTVVQNGDVLGNVYFYGDDGVDYGSMGARIHAVVDGTPGAGDMPTALVFSTTPDGAEVAAEAFRLTSKAVEKRYSSTGPWFERIVGRKPNLSDGVATTVLTFTVPTLANTECTGMTVRVYYETYVNGNNAKHKRTGTIELDIAQTFGGSITTALTQTVTERAMSFGGSPETHTTTWSVNVSGQDVQLQLTVDTSAGTNGGVGYVAEVLEHGGYNPGEAADLRITSAVN